MSKFHELEQQEIYLSSPNRLNDPMEGYKDVFWDGDATLWENLLGHYILALARALVGYLAPDGDTFTPPFIAAALSEERLRTDTEREIYRAARSSFLSSADVSDLPRALASIGFPLRAYGLRMILTTLHQRALHVVVGEFKKHNMMLPGFPDNLTTEVPISELLRSLPSDLQDPTQRSAFVETLGFSAAGVQDSQALRFYNDATDAASQSRLSRILFLIHDFPHRYVNDISDQLIHPTWFTACFTATCQSASMWSVYADEHRGAALVFKPIPDARGRPSLTLNMVTGMSYGPSKSGGVPVRSKIQGTLYPVNYSNRAPQIDFFKYLGQLPRTQLVRQWYTDKSGTISPLLQQRAPNQDVWREQLWQLLYDVAATKLDDWKHEQEYRLIMPDLLGATKAHPKVQFEFSELVGIVFGMKTRTSDKLEVMRLIAEKCKPIGRGDFQFWQMRYQPRKGQLVMV